MTEISNELINKKVNLIITLDPTSFKTEVNTKDSSSLIYKVKVFNIKSVKGEKKDKNSKFEKSLEVYQFNKIPQSDIKFSLSKHHINYLNNIENNNSLVNERDNNKKVFKNNVYSQLDNIEKYLNVVFEYLNKEENLKNKEDIIEINSVITELEELLSKESSLRSLSNESKKLNIVSEMSNLLISQINITDDINKRFLNSK